MKKVYKRLLSCLAAACLASGVLTNPIKAEGKTAGKVTFHITIENYDGNGSVRPAKTEEVERLAIALKSASDNMIYTGGTNTVSSGKCEYPKGSLPLSKYTFSHYHIYGYDAVQGKDSNGHPVTPDGAQLDLTSEAKNYDYYLAFRIDPDKVSTEKPGETTAPPEPVSPKVGPVYFNVSFVKEGTEDKAFFEKLNVKLVSADGKEYPAALSKTDDTKLEWEPGVMPLGKYTLQYTVPDGYQYKAGTNDYGVTYKGPGDSVDLSTEKAANGNPHSILTRLEKGAAPTTTTTKPAETTTSVTTTTTTSATETTTTTTAPAETTTTSTTTTVPAETTTTTTATSTSGSTATPVEPSNSTYLGAPVTIDTLPAYTGTVPTNSSVTVTSASKTSAAPSSTHKNEKSLPKTGEESGVYMAAVLLASALCLTGMKRAKNKQ